MVLSASHRKERICFGDGSRAEVMKLFTNQIFTDLTLRLPNP